MLPIAKTIALTILFCTLASGICHSQPRCAITHYSVEDGLSEGLLKINLRYEPSEPCERNIPPVVRNVTLEKVTSQQSKYGVYIIGLDKTINVSDITLKDCTFDGVEQGTSVTGAERVRLKNVIINGEKARL